MKIITHHNIFLRCSGEIEAPKDIWLLHGFGESGLSFREVMASSLANSYRLLCPDMPGFGVSPFDSNIESLRDLYQVILQLIREVSGDRPIVIMAHSMAGILGTWLCEELQNQVVYYINIEGNLDHVDCFFSGKANDYDDPNVFYHNFCQDLAKVRNNVSLERYYASVLLADPLAMYRMGRSSYLATAEAGAEFAALQTPKIYLWGDSSVSPSTQEFIRQHDLPNHRFENCGHWPMIEKIDEFLTVLKAVL